MTRDTSATRVQFFATCLVETVRPDAGLAAVRVLERLGREVSVPDGATCCGQPAFNAGLHEDAQAMARHTIDALSLDDAPVVVPSGSCADMIVHRYPQLLADDPEYSKKSGRLAARCHEWAAYVAALPDSAHPTAPTAAPARVAYHASCHLLRGLGVDREPRSLLDRGNVEAVPLEGDTECCGFGGLFAIEHSDVSGAILDRKLDAIEKAQADTLVACDVSCLLHIEGGLRRRGSAIRCRHLAEVLGGDG